MLHRRVLALFTGISVLGILGLLACTYWQAPDLLAIGALALAAHVSSEPPVEADEHTRWRAA